MIGKLGSCDPPPHPLRCPAKILILRCTFVRVLITILVSLNSGQNALMFIHQGIFQGVLTKSEPEQRYMYMYSVIINWTDSLIETII